LREESRSVAASSFLLGKPGTSGSKKARPQSAGRAAEFIPPHFGTNSRSRSKEKRAWDNAVGRSDASQTKIIVSAVSGGSKKHELSKVAVRTLKNLEKNTQEFEDKVEKRLAILSKGIEELSVEDDEDVLSKSDFIENNPYDSKTYSALEAAELFDSIAPLPGDTTEPSIPARFDSTQKKVFFNCMN